MISCLIIWDTEEEEQKNSPIVIVHTTNYFGIKDASKRSIYYGD